MPLALTVGTSKLDAVMVRHFADAAVSCRFVLAADAPAGSCFPGPGRDLPCEKRSAVSNT